VQRTGKIKVGTQAHILGVARTKAAVIVLSLTVVKVIAAAIATFTSIIMKVIGLG